MNILVAMNKVIREEWNSTWVELEELFSEFELCAGYNVYTEEHLFKSYWLKPWNCTDTWVGLSVLFLGEHPVAVRNQTCRKCDHEYHWLSESAAADTYAELMKLIKEHSAPSLVFLDKTFEIDEKYSLTYGDQVIGKAATWNGMNVQVVNCRPGNYADDPEGYLHAVRITLPDGTTKKIDVRELQFDLRTL